MSEVIIEAAREWLCRELADMSEEVYAAGWYGDWAAIVWEAATGGAAISRDAQKVRDRIGVERLQRLLAVAEATASWCGLDGDGHVVPVPLCEWLALEADASE